MQTANRVSRPGEYAGYSEPLYTEWVRTAFYLPVRDGTRLAVTLHRPAKDGVAVETAHPALLAATSGMRAYRAADGTESHYAENYAGGFAQLTKYGYSIAVIDARGRGASFGSSISRQDNVEAWDIHDVIDWLTAQPWCDGNVGMFGCSHVGANQMRALGTKPKGLKALFVASGATGDLYEKYQRGGIMEAQVYQGEGIGPGGGAARPERGPAPVDEDTDGSLLAQAMSSRRFNPSLADVWLSLPYRDSFSPLLSSRYVIDSGPLYNRSDLEANQAAVYHWLTWNDTTGTRLKLVDAANFDTPTKLMIGGYWGHCGGISAGVGRTITPPETEKIDFLQEHHRFFDYWLKGIENGIATEPPVYIYTKGREAGSEWRFVPQWPLPNEARTRLYFDGGRSGTAKSANDGRLSFALPAPGAGATLIRPPATFSQRGEGKHEGPSSDEADLYQVDYSIGTVDMDEKGLTYTSEPLDRDIEVTGHPVVHLWVSSEATDGDFFVLIEDIDVAGKSVLGPWPYIDGRLRASHRKLHEPEFDNLGLPWHRSHEEDIEPLTPGVPVELVFDVMPLSNLFKQGHRIRVTVAGSCLDGTGAAPQFKDQPAPRVTVYRGGDKASYIELPFVDTETIRSE